MPSRVERQQAASATEAQPQMQFLQGIRRAWRRKAAGPAPDLHLPPVAGAQRGVGVQEEGVAGEQPQPRVRVEVHHSVAPCPNLLHLLRAPHRFSRLRLETVAPQPDPGMCSWNQDTAWKSPTVLFFGPLLWPAREASEPETLRL